MKFYLVDSFANEPFTGNPAGVVLVDRPVSAAWMQAVARDVNVSETAFIDMPSAFGDSYGLRWFTPGAEVKLCGHATLAAAHVLGRNCSFSTLSGMLACKFSESGTIEMDFSADPAERSIDITVDALSGRTARQTLRGKFDLMAVFSSEADVAEFTPDMAAIAALSARGLIVTAPSDSEDIDYVARCFYPAIDVPEDPVTGSAHCTLATYWSEQLGREQLVGRQLSKRGGVVNVRVANDRVVLAGRAMTIIEGEVLATGVQN